MDMKASLLRTRSWGLGCGGGIAALARAADRLTAHPRKTALVVSLGVGSRRRTARPARRCQGGPTPEPRRRANTGCP
jgi:predicted naringenin-chalcone synthase